LPDGLFSNQKSQFWGTFLGLKLKNVDTVHGHLEFFKDIRDILWPLGKFCGHLVHFILFWDHAPRKLWQPSFRSTPINGFVRVLNCIRRSRSKITYFSFPRSPPCNHNHRTPEDLN
jgi:hypothetical protein